MKRDMKRRIRLPLRYIDGRWELEFGGEVPVIEGSRAELRVPEDSIADAKFRIRLRQKANIRILPRETRLLACLNVKDKAALSKEEQAALLTDVDINHLQALRLVENWSSAPFSFAEVIIGPATARQAKTLDMYDGGLWLTIEGNAPKGLTTSQIQLPSCFGNELCVSLNHAITRLSEVFEPWRLSHTGNVYERFLYQEADGRWYPLELLRSAEAAEQEQKFAFDLWQTFLARMKAKPK